MWARIETIIKSECKGTPKAPAYRSKSTRTYCIPATGGELTVQVYPKNCMISDGSVIFDEIPRDQIIYFLRAFIVEKNLTHK